MLTAIADLLALQEKHKDEHRDKHKDAPLSEPMYSVLRALEHASLSRKELFAAIGMTPDFRAFKRNVEPLINNGYIEMTLPDKPNSKLQKYRLTERGAQLIE